MATRPIIAIIGRPNVGKSTLFNRLIGRREAITSHQAGTTRDRHFGVMQWFGQSWTIVDTAGIIFEDDPDREFTDMEDAMHEQVAMAIDESDIIFFVADVKEGVNPHDHVIMDALRKQAKPVVVLVNKSDNPNLLTQAQAFHELGAEAIFPVSAIHGRGVRELVDYLMEKLPFAETGEARSSEPAVSIIGRPNVGKSTLINRLLGQNRLVVSDIPGTTRDSIITPITLPNGEQFNLIDTAGLRRKGKIEVGIEKFSLFRTLRAINASDLVIVLLTIEEQPTRGDAHVVAYALEAKKQVFIVLNKADLARDNIMQLTPEKQQKVGQQFLRRFPFMQRLPLYIISGQSGKGLDRLLDGVRGALSART